MNNFFLPSSSSFLRRRENQKRETSSQSEGSEIIEGVLWVHGAWENGEHRIFLMLGHGFREISSLYIILSEPNMSETEDQIKTVPIQCRYPFYTGADLRPVKAPWAPLVTQILLCNVPKPSFFRACGAKIHYLISIHGDLGIKNASQTRKKS